MKNLICSIVLVLLGVLLGAETSFAAFPAYSDPAVSVKTEKRSFDEFINATIEKYKLPAPPYNGEGADNPALSMASLAMGIGGFAALVVALELLAAVWLVPAALLGIAAIILGAMGTRRRPLRGVGIAGLVMGIIDVSILLVIGFFVLLVTAILGGF